VTKKKVVGELTKGVQKGGESERGSGSFCVGGHGKTAREKGDSRGKGKG